jgi:hypothetical protein
MKQFDLSVWLKDKSQKICTRDGRPVRIVCWDKLDDRPAAKEQKIVALVKEGCKENVFMYNNNGDGCISALDLFFADDEEKLTEFEKELEMMMVSFSNSNVGSDIRTEMPKDKLHNYAHKLRDLARKELEANYYTKVIDDKMVFKSELHEQSLQTAYDMGKQDVLKDLPKWKKYKGKLIGNGLIFEDNVNLVLVRNDYYIDINELDKLPKEE